MPTAEHRSDTYVRVFLLAERRSIAPSGIQAVVKMVVEEVNGTKPVIAGAGQAGTQETIKRCQYAQSIGADGILVVFPYYVPPGEEGIYQHYKRIAEMLGIAPKLM